MDDEVESMESMETMDPPRLANSKNTLRKRRRKTLRRNQYHRERSHSATSNVSRDTDITKESNPPPPPPRPNFKRKSITVLFKDEEERAPGTMLQVTMLKQAAKEKRDSMSKPIRELLDDHQVKAKARRKSMTLKQTMKERYLSTRVEQENAKKKVMNVFGRNYSAPKVEAYRVGFNVFNKADNQLVEHIDKMVDEFGLLSVYGERSVMTNLANAIKANYKSNPFHNFKHAFGVAHMAVVFMVREKSIARSLGKRKILAFIIAALGHDLNHPGNDNAFEITSGSKLVQEYNHQAVLENYHAHLLLGLLDEDDKNVFRFLSPKKQANIQEFIVEVVLATDMKQHNDHVNFLKQTMDFQKAIRSKVVRQGIMNAIMHACDLSGQCTDLEVAVSWEQRISQEFRKQAKLLEKRGQTVPAHLRSLEKDEVRAKLQLGFIEKVLKPLWSEISRCIPTMQPLYTNLTEVVQKYYQVLHEEGKQASQVFLERFRNVRVFNESGRDLMQYPIRTTEEIEEEDDEVVQI